MTNVPLDLLVANVALADHETVTRNVSVGCRAGKVAVIAHADERLTAERMLDGTGLVALPGVIDGHVHFRQPGLEHKETFASGAEAAVSGGVTCVLDMPNTEPPTTDRASFADKVELVGSSSWVDFGLFGLLTRDNLDDLPGLIDAGAVGIKCFMGQSEEGPGCPLPPDDGVLYRAMTVLAGTGRRLAVHAENHDIMRRLIAELRPNRRDLAAHEASRPPFVEVEAVQRAALLADQSGAGLHVLHLSSAMGLGAVTEWRARGVDLTCETTPHHCLITDVAVGSRLQLRVNPPVRGGADATALLAGVRSGTVDAVASDHAPHAAGERSEHDLWSCRPGVPGVGTIVNVLLSEGVATGELTLPDVARAVSFGPSRVWNLYPRKGVVRVGSDADLTLVDLTASWSLPADDRGAFYGRSGRGKAVGAVLRGAVAMWDGELTEPSGRLVRPAHHTPRSSGTSSRR